MHRYTNFDAIELNLVLRAEMELGQEEPFPGALLAITMRTLLAGNTHEYPVR